MMRRIFFIGLLCALLPLTAACGSTAPAQSAAKSVQHVSLMLDWYPNSDHAGIYSAIDEGIYKKAGLAVKPFVPSDPTAALKLVAAGKTDFAVSYEPEVLIARAQGVPVKAVVALVTRPLDSIIVLKRSGITSPKQLKGKKIGMTGLPSDTASVKAVLNDVGLKLSDVTQVSVGYNLVPSLLSHKVDAIIGGYWSWEALQIRDMGHPDTAFRLDDYGVPRYDELVVVTSDKMIKQKPALVRAFVQATQQGLAYAAAHPSKAAGFIVKAGKGLKPSLVQQSVKLLVPVFSADGVPGGMTASSWSSFASWMQKHHLVKKPVTGGDAMTTTFLKK